MSRRTRKIKALKCYKNKKLSQMFALFQISINTAIAIAKNPLMGEIYQEICRTQQNAILMQPVQKPNKYGKILKPKGIIIKINCDRSGFKSNIDKTISMLDLYNKKITTDK